MFRDECLRGAKYLSRLLEALGAEVKMAQPYEGKNPVVLGRLGHNPAHPTVAFYGHYDVQVSWPTLFCLELFHFLLFW